LTEPSNNIKRFIGDFIILRLNPLYLSLLGYLKAPLCLYINSGVKFSSQASHSAPNSSSRAVATARDDCNSLMVAVDWQRSDSQSLNNSLA
jgi:hypothetical protein